MVGGGEESIYAYSMNCTPVEYFLSEVSWSDLCLCDFKLFSEWRAGSCYTEWMVKLEWIVGATVISVQITRLGFQVFGKMKKSSDGRGFGELLLLLLRLFQSQYSSATNEANKNKKKIWNNPPSHLHHNQYLSACPRIPQRSSDKLSPNLSKMSPILISPWGMRIFKMIPAH